MFGMCSKLTTIMVDEGNENYYIKDNCLIDAQNKILIWGTNDSIIPDDGSITTIGPMAFQYINWVSVVIPEGVVTIGEQAFASSSLRSVTLPKTLKNLPFGAFSLSVTSLYCTIP